jgi:hypothetical protein
LNICTTENTGARQLIAAIRCLREEVRETTSKKEEVTMKRMSIPAWQNPDRVARRRLWAFVTAFLTAAFMLSCVAAIPLAIKY